MHDCGLAQEVAGLELLDLRGNEQLTMQKLYRATVLSGFKGAAYLPFSGSQSPVVCRSSASVG